MADQNQSSVLNPSSIDNSGSSNSTGSSSSSPGTSGSSSTQAGGPQLNAQGQRQQGTGFTNLSKYLQAGQNTGSGGTSAGQQLGNAINQGVSNQANQFNTNLGTSQNQFNTNLSQNSLGSYTDANNQNASNVNSTINSIINPSGGSTVSQPNSTTTSQFQNYLSGNYAGPTSLGNTQQLGLQAQNLQQLGQSTQSAGGVGGLLQQFASSPNKQYTQGEQGLDSLLVGQQGQSGLNAANQVANQTTQQYNAAQQNATQAANQAALGNKAFAQSTLGALQGAINPIDTSVQQASAAQNTANQANLAQASTLANQTGGILAKMGITSTSSPAQQAAGLQSLINSGYINASNVGSLGIGQDLAGNINLNNLYTQLQNQTANTAGETTTPGQMVNGTQAAQLQALQSLAGGNSILPSDISQAQIQAAQGPNATTYQAPNAISNAVNVANVFNTGTNALTPAQAAGYTQVGQLQTQLAQLNPSAYNNPAYYNNDVASLQAQIAAAQAAQNTPTQQAADLANTPLQFQNIQSLLNAANGGSPGPKQNTGSGTYTPTVGVGTGSRIG